MSRVVSEADRDREGRPRGRWRIAERDGRVRRGWLGFAGQTTRIPRRVVRLRKLASAQGIRVVSIEKKGPARRGGLRTGDIIVALAGRPVEGVDALRRLLTEDQIGQTCSLDVLRKVSLWHDDAGPCLTIPRQVVATRLTLVPVEAP